MLKKHKYLGNIVKSTRRIKEDAFGESYEYLCDQASKALFDMYKKKLKMSSDKMAKRVFIELNSLH